MTLQSSHECHLVDRPSMVTWRAIGAGTVELVETPPKLDRRPRRMGTLGVADPGDGGPKLYEYVVDYHWENTSVVNGLVNTLKPDVILLQEHWLTPANLYLCESKFVDSFLLVNLPCLNL